MSVCMAITAQLFVHTRVFLFLFLFWGAFVGEEGWLFFFFFFQDRVKVIDQDVQEHKL